MKKNVAILLLVSLLGVQINAFEEINNIFNKKQYDKIYKRYINIISMTVIGSCVLKNKIAEEIEIPHFSFLESWRDSIVRVSAVPLSGFNLTVTSQSLGYLFPRVLQNLCVNINDFTDNEQIINSILFLNSWQMSISFLVVFFGSYYNGKNLNNNDNTSSEEGDKHVLTSDLVINFFGNAFFGSGVIKCFG